MTYSCAYWCTSLDETLSSAGFDDSKTLSHEQRTRLFKKMEDSPDVGYGLRVIQASEISRCMLRRDPYNLNAISHDTAIKLIKDVMSSGVNVRKVYIDTVGNADMYKTKLDNVFYGKGLDFVVESKADSTYKVVSAASICAKVARDEFVARWKWSEGAHYSSSSFSSSSAGGGGGGGSVVGTKDFGSGYPSDPKCKEWMAGNLVDPVFCYPDFVRFSWAPAKDAIKSRGAAVRWEADDDDDDDDKKKKQIEGQSALSAFFGGGDGSEERKRKRKKIGGSAITRGFAYAEW